MHVDSAQVVSTQPLVYLLVLAKQNNPSLKDGTLKHYRSTINLVQKWAGRALTCDEFFQLDQVKAWVAWMFATPPSTRRLLQKPAPRMTSTIRNKMLTVRTLWRLARSERLCSSKVPLLRKFPKVKVVKEDPIAWSIEEVETIRHFSLKAPAVEWWTPMHWYTILSAYFVSVERHTALLSCELSDLSPDNILSIRAKYTKDGKPGTIYLPERLAEMIRALPRAEGHWIPEHLKTKIWQWPYGRESMRNHLRRDILEPAGLPADRYHLFHCLRKSGITELVNLVGLEAASGQARHFSQGMTLDIYVSQAKLRAKPASAILGDALRPN